MTNAAESIPKVSLDKYRKVNQDSYDNGLTPVSDLLEARALLQQAQDQAVEARAHYLTQRSHYLQATGRLQH